MLNRPVTRSVSAELRARAGFGSNGGSGGALGFNLPGLDMDSTLSASQSRAENNRESNDELILRAMIESAANQGNGNDLIGLLGTPQVNRISSEELFQAWLSSNSENLTTNEQAIPSPSSNEYNNSDFNRQSVQENRRLSGELSSLIASFQQTRNDMPRTQENAVDASFIGSNWMLEARGNSSHSGRSNATNNQNLVEKLTEIARQEDLKAQRSRNQISPPSTGHLSSWQPTTPVTRSKSSELRRAIASLGSPVPSTDDLLQTLAKSDLSSVLSSLRAGGNSSNLQNTANTLAAEAANQRNQQLLQSALLQNVINSMQHQQQSAQSPSNMMQDMLPSRSPRAHLNGLTDDQDLGDAKVSAVVSMLKGNLEKKKMASVKPAQGSYLQENTWNLPSPKLTHHRQLRQEQGHFSQLQTRSPDLSNATGQLSATVGSPSSSSGKRGDSAAGNFSELTSGQGHNSNAMRNQLQKGSGLGKRGLGSVAEVEESMRKRQELLEGGISLGYAGAAQKLLNKQKGIASAHQSGSLNRTPSLNSSGTSGGTASKLHRVERHRKMMEAKGRMGGVQMTTDAEALKKKCESLETEVRSLKTFQSFMNRKDSEQTTKIEELQAKNTKLTEERDQLQEELANLRNNC